MKSIAFTMLALMIVGTPGAGQKTSRKGPIQHYVTINSKQLATILHLYPDLRVAKSGWTLTAYGFQDGSIDVSADWPPLPDGSRVLVCHFGLIIGTDGKVRSK
jgi:hypothetical protein